MTEAKRKAISAEIRNVLDGLTNRTDAYVLGMALGNLGTISGLVGENRRLQTLKPNLGLTEDEATALLDEINKASGTIISFI